MIRHVRTVALGFVLLVMGSEFAPRGVPAEEPEPLSYTITDLGTLGGWSSVALAVNRRGQVVGSADTSQGVRHAYVWQRGMMTDLGTLPGDAMSEAWDINNSGLIVGVGTTPEGYRHAFVMTPPPPIPAVSGYGTMFMTLFLLAAGMIVVARGRRTPGFLPRGRPRPGAPGKPAAR